MEQPNKYTQEEQSLALGFTQKDSLEEVSEAEMQEIIILSSLSELGMKAEEFGFHDLSSILRDVELLYSIGAGKSISKRLRKVVDNLLAELTIPEETISNE